MKRIVAFVMLLVVSLAALGLVAGLAAADDAIVAPGSYHEKKITMTTDSTISYSWTSNGTLVFELKDPSGAVLRTHTGTFGTGLYTVDHGGVYTLVWTNSGSNPVTINYTVEALDVGGGFLDDLGDAIVLGLLIVLAVIVIIVVIVILVVVRGKKKTPQSATGPGGAVITPMGNNCAVCGTPVDRTMAFCAKCGAKLR